MEGLVLARSLEELGVGAKWVGFSRFIGRR